jgi:hypothetical protein
MRVPDNPVGNDCGGNREVGEATVVAEQVGPALIAELSGKARRALDVTLQDRRDRIGLGRGARRRI